MRISNIQLLFVAAIAYLNLGLNYQAAPNPPPQIKGSFTIKGSQQVVRLVPPTIDSTQIMTCVGGCDVVLKFADPTIPNITVKGSIGGTLYNLGDLNGDGKDEIGILHEWFTSCWSAFDVYTFKNGVWEMAVPPISTHCNQWEANVKPIVKDPKRKGFVIISYSAFAHGEIVVKTKSVKVR